MDSTRSTRPIDRRACSLGAGVAILIAACAGGREALRAGDSAPIAEPPPSCDADDAGNGAIAGEPAIDPVRAAEHHLYFKISVLDAADKTPVAGAALVTVNQIRYVSDSHGVVAFYEPGLMATS